MKKISADRIYTVSNGIIENGIIVVDELGKILDIYQGGDNFKVDTEYHQGWIVPGFINAHCHLELSHLKGKVNTGTGLIPFITSVVKYRDFPEEVIQEKIRQADKEMRDAGIVAVGDISNTLDTESCKAKSSIQYYTFVEMFDFLQNEKADEVFLNAQKVYDEHSGSNGNRKSAVPHAPYSVSPRLFEHIKKLNSNKKCTVSIHNQETYAEDRFFRYKKGEFIEFYESFGIDLTHFHATKMPSIYYALSNMDASQRTLLVHNTATREEDILLAESWSEHVYWISCPNANLYIENQLPNYGNFKNNNAKIALGTDSLTSNWQLSILEEMKTIAKYQSTVHFDELIRWATINGALALGFDDKLGSIEIGKTPGLNLLYDPQNNQMDTIQNFQVRRII